MNEPFFIPVQYKGREMEFETTLQRHGYVHSFHVNVDGTMVIYEKDEEGSFRALIPEGEKGKVPEKGLLQAIGEVIEEILK
jgi:hypothetical protein